MTFSFNEEGTLERYSSHQSNTLVKNKVEEAKSKSLADLKMYRGQYSPALVRNLFCSSENIPKLYNLKTCLWVARSKTW